ncbi:hypothetical protein BJY04DRAFT_233253 [Aspergillus karnatakaensis]|uniref:uncharacterized protein n=1 Tax=Aspergillus karnatakaensis TaxID=1810916 RepID=UPI003CCD7033
MSSPRKITNYFKRPSFAVAARDTRSNSPAEDPAPATQSSPLTELSQLLPSDFTAPDTPDGPSSQLKRSLFLSAEEPEDNDPALQSSFQSAGSGTPFSSSQRVIKKGKEVVIDSDGDETDSVDSLPNPDTLFAQVLTPTAPKPESEMDDDAIVSNLLRPRKKLRPGTFKAPPVYKNSLESLVVEAVSEYDTEAGIAKLKAEREAQAARENDSANALTEDAIASALGGGTEDGTSFQRLLDAMKRTETFDLAKSWSFFDLQTPLPSPPDFPRDCVCPGTYMATLREPGSRERAFCSGIIDFALSRDLLADDLIKWIFHSIPSEPRDNLRHAYCRAFKRTTARRMKLLIRPEDVDTLFWQMSARPEVLVLSDPIIPDKQPPSRDTLESQRPHHKALISILDVFRDTADLFADDTRERILSILLRLPLDASLTRHTILCSELERTITAVLDAVPDYVADDLANDICSTAHATLKDAELQSRLLEHIAPANDWIATLRRRLAYIFLTDNPIAEPLTPNKKSSIHRIIIILKDPRFDVKRYKRKGQPEYDYGELTAVTTFLNIIVDSGWSETKFADERAEDEFNGAVDNLAERVKKIFSAIEDAGASHLKRTLAKEALESLHYRIVYAVRTKPPPKKTLFGQHDPQPKTQNLLKYVKKKQVVILSDKPGS